MSPAGNISWSGRRAFTLIELMTAAMILGMIGLTILTTFASGFHVYERLQLFGGVQADALIALEEIEKDLNNSFPFGSIPVEGEAQNMSFPSVSENLVTVDGEDKSVPVVGRVTYAFDSETNTLTRSWVDYAQAVGDTEEGGHVEEVMAEIDAVAFSYGTFNEEEQAYQWGESYIPGVDGALTGVKIDIAYAHGGKEVDLSRYVKIRAQKTEEEVVEDGEEAEGDEDDAGESGGAGETELPAEGSPPEG